MNCDEKYKKLVDYIKNVYEVIGEAPYNTSASDPFHPVALILQYIDDLNDELPKT